MRIADRIRGELFTRFRPGHRLPGDKALADQLGTSNGAIRDAMFFLESQGFVERRSRSGTYVADRRKTSCVGIYCSHNPLHARVMPHTRLLAFGLVERLKAMGLSYRLYFGDRVPGLADQPKPQCPQLLSDIEAWRLSSLVSLSRLPPAWVKRMRERKVVIAGTASDDTDITLAGEHFNMLELGLRRLVDRGCKAPAVLFWREARGDRRSNFVDHYLDLCRSLGVQANVKWAVGDVHPAAPGAGWHDFQTLWSATTPEHRPDGLLIADDLLFPEAAMAILTRGLSVPEDLRVVTQAHRGMGTLYPFDVDRIVVDPLQLANDIMDAVWSRLSDRTMSPCEVDLCAQLDQMPAGSNEPSLVRAPGLASKNAPQFSHNPGSP